MVFGSSTQDITFVMTHFPGIADYFTQVVATPGPIKSALAAMWTVFVPMSVVFGCVMRWAWTVLSFLWSANCVTTTNTSYFDTETRDSLIYYVTLILTVYMVFQFTVSLIMIPVRMCITVYNIVMFVPRILYRLITSILVFVHMIACAFARK